MNVFTLLTLHRSVGIIVLDNEKIHPFDNELEIVGIGDISIPRDYRPQDVDKFYFLNLLS